MKNKDKYFIDMAILTSKQSYSKRNKVGAILEKDGRVLITGYNGTLPGDTNICEIKDITKDNVVHAEQNVISFAAKYGIATKDCALYVTLSPCVLCAKMIIQAGITEVIYKEDYRDISGLQLLRDNNILVRKY